MARKMTISMDDEVYHGLLTVVGKRKVSRFISDLVRPHVIEGDLEAGYKAMAADEEYEAEAQEWLSLARDFND